MHRIFIIAAIVLAAAGLGAAETRTIDNPLRQGWPHELVSLDFPPDRLDAYGVVTGMGEPRPVQWERTQRDGQPVARAWFIATIEGQETTDDKGRTKREKPPASIDLGFEPGSAEPGIRVSESGDYWLVDTGAYEMRIRNFQGLDGPTPFDRLPHWFGGSRVAGTDTWDGKAWSEGTGVVSDVRTELINRGPVLVDFHITYTFADNQTTGTVDALPLLPSKRTHFEVEQDGIQTRETIPAHSHHYELVVRCVAGDPWAEVVERYRLPKDPQVSDWGQHQYYIQWGETRDHLPYELIPIPREEHVAIDTAMWVRWFEYDTFGGNNSLNIVPAEPRPAQKGRPFALLRPRWNQGGGGAQDFFLTSGGKPPLEPRKAWDRLEDHIQDRRKKAAKNEEEASELDRVTADPSLAADKKQELLAKKGKLRHEAREALKGLDDIDGLLSQAKEQEKAKDDTALMATCRELAGRIGYDLPGGPDYDPEAPAYGIVAAYPSKWVGPYIATIAAYVRDGQRAVRLGLRDGGGGEGEDGPSDDNWYGQRSYAIVTGPRRWFDSTGEVDALVRRHTDWTLTALANTYILDWERDAENALGPHILMNRERLLQLREDHASGRETPEMAALAETMVDYAAIRAELDELRALAGDAKDQAKDKIKDLEKQLGKGDFKLAALIRGDPVSPGGRQGPNPHMYWKRYQDDANNPTNYGNRRLVNGPFPEHDLYTVDKPFGNADVAAIGYIYSDLDAWPGYQNGWTPGNPNFHTDKYLAAVFAGASMPDHPHAGHWVAFGQRNFLEDLGKVLVAPDGVGWECPGYSGYAMHLQLETARIIFNSGMGNPVTENPLIKANAIWHRHLITPYDFRIDRRHEAPHGDTHRWDSGLSEGFAELAPFYARSDPAFASELMGTYRLLVDSGAGMKKLKSLEDLVTKTDLSIPAMPADEMDWTGRAFFGFGAVMRDGFGTADESFLSLRAGRTSGHYHNDHLAYHFYAGGTPISLDYNCSYHPRGDHAALHNSMTFGVEGEVRHNQRGTMVPAMEQLGASGRVGAFTAGRFADAVVAERSGDGLGMSPVDPHDHEFSRGYPGRRTDRIVHRRLLAMVKHEDDSALGDYLVVRDETISNEPQQLNVHVLARELERDGDTMKLWGQYDQDMVLHVAQATDLEVDRRWWWYEDEWMLSPGTEYELKPGESQAAWAQRMEALRREKGWDRIPGPDWAPRWKGKNEEESKRWLQLIHETDGKALLPPPGWSAEANWMYGEIQMWLRLSTAPGTPTLWVLYPFERGTEAPRFETLEDGHAVRVTLGGESETIRMGTGLEGGAITIERGGETEVLVDQLPPLGEIEDQPLD